MTHPHFFVTFLLNLSSVKERCVQRTMKVLNEGFDDCYFSAEILQLHLGAVHKLRNAKKWRFLNPVLLNKFDMFFTLNLELHLTLIRISICIFITNLLLNN